jgi:hypothetical protein
MRWIIIFATLVFLVFLAMWNRSPPQVVPLDRTIQLAIRREERVEAARDPPVLRYLAECDERVKRGDWSALLDIAVTYSRGSYPAFRPDPVMAAEIYKLAATCPDPRIAAIARTELLGVTDVPAIDIAGTRIPSEYGRRALIVVPPYVPQPRVLAKRTDPQNAHDHSVTAGLKKRLAALETLKEPDLPGDIVAQVTDFVLECDNLDAATKSDALEVLDSLHDIPHSTLGVSERGALEKVWNRIQSSREPKNASETLCRQLASGVERGHVVCSTGKISRILGALDGIDDITLRPMWAVREEIATLAAKTRDDVPEEVARDLFRKRAVEIYVDDLGMSRAVIDAVIDEFAAGF